MESSTEHPRLRPTRLNSYRAYAIGCFLAWGVVWAIVALTSSNHRIDQIAIFFGGWLLGWGSATIARVVYPPPRHRESTTPRSFFQGFRGNT